jgi:hypothetical protein
VKKIPDIPTRTCSLDGCDETFEVTSRTAHKLYCCENHQRTAEKRRYRARRVEMASCKGCGEVFWRAATTRRAQVYCSVECQYEARSAEYRTAPDIEANLRRAQRIRRRKAQGLPLENKVVFL